MRFSILLLLAALLSVPALAQQTPVEAPARKTVVKQKTGPARPAPKRKARRKTKARTTQPVLIFQKTPCMGVCPAYKATLYADGRLQYEGEKYVPLLGKHSLRLPADTVAYIRREAERIGFARLASTYSQNSSDLPSTYLSVRQPDGTLKEVRVDEGEPAELTKLLDYIHRQITRVAVATK